MVGLGGYDIYMMEWYGHESLVVLWGFGNDVMVW